MLSHVYVKHALGDPLSGINERRPFLTEEGSAAIRKEKWREWQNDDMHPAKALHLFNI